MSGLLDFEMASHVASVAMSSLCKQEWLWTSGPPSLISWVLAFQACMYHHAQHRVIPLSQNKNGRSESVWHLGNDHTRQHHTRLDTWNLRSVSTHCARSQVKWRKDTVLCWFILIGFMRFGVRYTTVSSRGLSLHEIWNHQGDIHLGIFKVVSREGWLRGRKHFKYGYQQSLGLVLSWTNMRKCPEQQHSSLHFLTVDTHMTSHQPHAPATRTSPSWWIVSLKMS